MSSTPMTAPARWHRGLIAIAAAAAALLASACGSSSTSSGIGGTASHDSPDGAVRGLVQALVSFDGSDTSINNLLQWVAPSQAATTRSALQAFSSSGAKVTFKVDNFDIAGVVKADATHATVTTKGTASACLSIAAGGATGINTCQPLTENTFKAAQESGKWYVADFGPGTGTSGSSSSSSPSDTGSSSTTTESSSSST
jgi:hypothetical protein